VKLVPEIVTVVPDAPLVGVMLVIFGADGLVMVKEAALVAVPPFVVTVIGPLVALSGTVAVMRRAEETTYFAAVPLKATALAPRKFAPETVTLIPGEPLAGLNPEIVGFDGRCCAASRRSGAGRADAVWAAGTASTAHAAPSKSSLAKVCFRTRNSLRRFI